MILRLAALTCALTVLPGLVQAAAWTQAKGAGQVIGGVYHSESPRGFNAAGNEVAITPYNKTDATVFAEYGLTDRFTVFGQTGVQSIEIEGVDKSTGWGYTELGGKWRLAEPQGGAFSLQASARIPGQKSQQGPAQVGNSDSQIDVRALWGRGFKLAERDAFINAEAGYRVRNGAPPNETHVDLTFGYRPTPRLLLLAQSFNTISDGAGSGVFTDYRYSNLQLGMAYDVQPNLTLHAGWVGTIDGENALRERGFNIGFWRRF